MTKMTDSTDMTDIIIMTSGTGQINTELVAVTIIGKMIKRQRTEPLGIIAPVYVRI